METADDGCSEDSSTCKFDTSDIQALCEEVGGQLMTLSVELKCDEGSTKLENVPILCAAASCDLSNDEFNALAEESLEAELKDFAEGFGGSCTFEASSTSARCLSAAGAAASIAATMALLVGFLL